MVEQFPDRRNAHRGKRLLRATSGPDQANAAQPGTGLVVGRREVVHDRAVLVRSRPRRSSAGRTVVVAKWARVSAAAVGRWAGGQRWILQGLAQEHDLPVQVTCDDVPIQSGVGQGRFPSMG